MKTVAGLLRALEDIENNARGPVSLYSPSDIHAMQVAENIVHFIFASDFEYWRVCASYCAGLKSADINSLNDRCWANLNATVCDALSVVPYNKMVIQYLVQVILTEHKLGTCTFDLLDIASDERKLDPVPSISEEMEQMEFSSVLQLEMRPRSDPSKQLLVLLYNDQMVLAGFGCDSDKIVLQDPLGIECIDTPEQCHYVTRNQGEHRLLRQFQLADMQKALAPLHMPAVAGYDNKEPDPVNLPINMSLGVCAKTGLTCAVTSRFCAAILQDAIYKHHCMGNTELKLFQYHDEAATLTVLIHAPMDVDERRAAMERRGMGKWAGIECAQMLTPNRQCWEATMKWVHMDGMMAQFMLKIWDRVYNLSDAITTVKKSMESFTEHLAEHHKNVVHLEHLAVLLRFPDVTRRASAEAAPGY